MHMGASYREICKSLQVNKMVICISLKFIQKKLKIFYVTKNFFRIVAPKQERLANAMEELRQKQAMLAAAKKKLEEIAKYLERLKKEYEEKYREKEELLRRV